MKPLINEKLTEILGFEDNVVIDYAINQLENTNLPNAKSIQINLTGFLNAKVVKTNLKIFKKILERANIHGGAVAHAGERHEQSTWHTGSVDRRETRRNGEGEERGREDERIPE